MLRPRWIALLLLCLVVAGVFAWLGQWQLGRAIDTDPTPPGATEEVRPLADVADAGGVPAGAARRAARHGRRAPGSREDFLVVESRFNDGVEGYWVTGQLRLWDGARFDEGDQPVSLAVAIGWAADPGRRAEAAASALEQLAADAGAAGIRWRAHRPPHLGRRSGAAARAAPIRRR